ncbi:HOMOSERINE O-ACETYLTRANSFERASE [Ceraceosorus bombacis]|uniref:HOMOSERINE O-ACETYLTRANSFERASE n=1 Tax=Ceraceosorus bombacis TaxID=401625 RepID=A0A0P1BFW7_9BASI|nr:HOMOSERINE O-ACETYLTRANSFERASE [Ceraceosorus bombacis]
MPRYSLPRLVLTSGDALSPAILEYSTWGTLNEQGDNCIVIGHAMTGSQDVQDWWPGLVGPNNVPDCKEEARDAALSKESVDPLIRSHNGEAARSSPGAFAIDTTKYFVFCANILGSPYGSSSPLSIDERTGKCYGPDFPLTNTRDDAQLQLHALAHLGVKSIACALGGSMGGMLVLELALAACAAEGPSPRIPVRTLMPIASTLTSSSWIMGWNEIQRAAIQMDPAFDEGRYCWQMRRFLRCEATQALGNGGEKVVVLGIPTDRLFAFSEQQDMARFLDSELCAIESMDGHDAFLIKRDLVASKIEQLLCVS